MMWRAWVRGWRARRVLAAGKGSLPVPVRIPVRVNAVTSRRSTLPVTPVALVAGVCGAIDRLSGAVCTQPPGRWHDRHVDTSDPACRIEWPDDEWTTHRTPVVTRGDAA